MNDTTITIRGNAGSIPTLRQSPNGTVWTSFRLASTSRRRAPDGSWEDKATLWVSVTVFRALAERVAATVRKGTPLTIVGDLSHEEWVTQDGAPRSGPAVIAQSVAVDLTGGSRVTWARIESPSGHAEHTPSADSFTRSSLAAVADGESGSQEAPDGEPRDVSHLVLAGVGAGGVPDAGSGSDGGSSGGSEPPF
jgi:single-strand DNA-binding protein